MSEKKANDAYLGSKKDRHELLGEGYIWKDSMEPLVYLLDRCQKWEIPMILETHSLDMLTLKALSDDN